MSAPSGPPHIIDGKALSAATLGRLQEAIPALTRKLGRPPGLAVILVGDDSASKVYVASKEKSARNCGIAPFNYHLPKEVQQERLEDLIRELNGRDDVDGILLQLPLPKALDELRAIAAIAPEKDVDGLTPFNQGLLLRDAPYFEPCTPKGVLALLDHTRAVLGLDGDIAGMRALVVGRSLLVGKPVSLMLLRRHCTVTVAHSRTRELRELCQSADILIAAVGKPEMIRGEWVKPGSMVIDVGINRLGDGRLVGDVEYEGARKVVRAITPVPGGVGPMTIAMLLQNTVESAAKKTQEGVR